MLGYFWVKVQLWSDQLRSKDVHFSSLSFELRLINQNIVLNTKNVVLLV